MTGSPTHQLRLPYLMACDGAAAVYVVMFHAVMGFAVELSGPFRALKLVFGFGHEAVAIFIVLSGYCLMLPVLSRNDGQLKGGFWGYLRRRAFRILPPYFAVVALSLLLIVCVPVLGRAARARFGTTLCQVSGSDPSPRTCSWSTTGFPRGRIRSTDHSGAWPVSGRSISSSHCYCCRCGDATRQPSCSAAQRSSATCPFCSPAPPPHGPRPGTCSCSRSGCSRHAWAFSERSGERRWRERIDWRKVCAALWLFCGLAGTLGARIWFRFLPLTDVLVGAATAALLVQCTSQATGRSPRGLVLRALESRLLLGIGHFSYSLYLTHLPVVALCYFALRELGVSSAPVLALAMLVTSVPASLLAAAAFYWAVERHFIKARP